LGCRVGGVGTERLKLAVAAGAAKGAEVTLPQALPQPA